MQNTGRSPDLIPGMISGKDCILGRNTRNYATRTPEILPIPGSGRYPVEGKLA